MLQREAKHLESFFLILAHFFVLKEEIYLI